MKKESTGNQEDLHSKFDLSDEGVAKEAEELEEMPDLDKYSKEALDKVVDKFVNLDVSSETFKKFMLEEAEIELSQETVAKNEAITEHLDKALKDAGSSLVYFVQSLPTEKEYEEAGWEDKEWEEKIKVAKKSS